MNNAKLTYQRAMVEREVYQFTDWGGVADGKAPGSCYPGFLVCQIYNQYTFPEGPPRYLPGFGLATVYERCDGSAYALSIEKPDGRYADVALAATSREAALVEATALLRAKRLARAGHLAPRDFRPNSVNDWYGASDAGVFVPRPDGSLSSVGSSYARALAALAIVI